MARKINHDQLRDIDVLSSIGKLHIDKDGNVNIKGLSDEQIDQLVSIPHFNEPNAVQKEEVKIESEKQAEDDSEPEDKKVNLYTMKVSDLKDYAAEHNIELTSTKRNEMINEIKEAEK